MPMPATYRHASREFSAYLEDAKDRMSLISDNSAYTATDAVFQVFRKRLTVDQGLVFADQLPCVLRAIFVTGWHPQDPPLPFADRETLTREVQEVRKDHNLTPDNAISAVAWAVRRCVRHVDFDRVLHDISPDAVAYWHATEDYPGQLSQRIV